MDILKDYERHTFNPTVDDKSLLPKAQGVYAICAYNVENIKSIMNDVTLQFIGDSPVIYIGISESQGLAKRDYKNHFHGTARNSTLRKSIGSLFDFNRIFYKDGKYKFTLEDEEKLTKWMHENLFFYYWLVDRDIKETETELINLISPPLNLSKNKSPVNKEFRSRLSELRNRKV